MAWRTCIDVASEWALHIVVLLLASSLPPYFEGGYSYFRAARDRIADPAERTRGDRRERSVEGVACELAVLRCLGELVIALALDEDRKDRPCCVDAILHVNVCARLISTSER